MSITTVSELLQDPEARSLRSLRGVSNCQTPRGKVRANQNLHGGAESAESESLSSHPHAHTRARGAKLGKTDSANSRDSAPLPGPGDATEALPVHGLSAIPPGREQGVFLRVLYRRHTDRVGHGQAILRPAAGRLALLRRLSRPTDQQERRGMASAQP